MANLKEQAKALYLYGFPLVVTEATHWGSDDKGFHHLRTFPTDKVNKIVKLNNDTLYSTAWTQLAQTPYLVHIPKITERYYLFPILDAYTNVVESIGTRTPDRAEGDYILLYQDTPVPAGYESYRVIRLQDSLNAVLLRIETRGKADYPVVNRIQDSITIRPLYPERVRPVRQAPEISPAAYIETVSPKEFFTLFAALSVENPIRNEAYVQIFEQFGYDRVTGTFPWDALTAEQQQALIEGSRLGFAEIQKGKRDPQYTVQHRGWLSVIGGVGTYGTDYLQRAETAYGGWGARTAPMLLRRQMTAAHHWKAGTATGCTFRQTVIPTHPCSGRSRCTANPASIWCPIPLDGLRSTPMICRTAAWKRIRTVRWIFSFPLTNRKRNWHGKTGCRRRKRKSIFHWHCVCIRRTNKPFGANGNRRSWNAFKRRKLQCLNTFIIQLPKRQLHSPNSEMRRLPGSFRSTWKMPITVKWRWHGVAA